MPFPCVILSFVQLQMRSFFLSHIIKDPSRELHSPHAGLMLSRTYLPPSTPAIGKRSTVTVFTVNSVSQPNEHKTTTPSPNVSSSHCFLRALSLEEPRSLRFVVPLTSPKPLQ